MKSLFNKLNLLLIVVSFFMSINISAQKYSSAPAGCECSDIPGFKVTSDNCVWEVINGRRVCVGYCEYKSDQGGVSGSYDRCTPTPAPGGKLSSENYKAVHDVSKAYPNADLKGSINFDVLADGSGEHALKYTVSNELGNDIDYMSANASVPYGDGTVIIDFKDLEKGTYTVNFQIDDQKFTRKVIL